MNRVPLLALASLLVGCGGFRGAHPTGFAPWTDNGPRSWRAASPEGLVWHIRTEPHEPKADLDFWKRSLRERLDGAGYHIVDSLAFRMGDQPAWAFEAGLEEDAWLVAISPGPDGIVVAEAAGSTDAFQKRRGAILEALTRIQPR